MLAWPTLAMGQFKDHIHQQVDLEANRQVKTIVLANINGAMKVEGFSGNQVIIDVDRSITGKTTERLEQGKKEVQVRQINRVDTLIVYGADGCTRFTKGKRKWSYNGRCEDDDCKTEYDYTLNFTVKVPYGMNVEVSTINHGNITVSNIQGIVVANNINGAIELSSIQGAASASTINGDVNIEYVRNPDRDCRYYTLNGDINATFIKGLAATVGFKSFNGSFFTNLPKLESLPTLIEQEPDKEGVKLKISSNRYKVGAGGVLQDFETFNGDVVLKEK